MSLNVNLLDKEKILHAIDQVRSENGNINWLLLAHQDKPNEVILQATGNGGVDEMKAHLDDNKVQYALIRTHELIDKSNTTKFVYVYFIGEGVPFAKRGRFGVVKGNVTKHLQPYHVDFEISSSNEIGEEIIAKKISEASGTANKTHGNGRARSESTGQKQAAKKASNSPSVVREVGVGLSVSQDVLDSIKQLRDDRVKLKWVLASYAAVPQKNQPVEVVKVGSGHGGENEWRGLLDNEKVIYGLFRVTDQIDQSATVKFVFLQFIGKDVPPMAKAKVSTLHAAVKQQFGISHVDFISSDPKELSDATFLDKVKEAHK